VGFFSTLSTVADAQVAVLERGVAETVSKLEAGSNLVCIKPPIINQTTLTIDDLRSSHRARIHDIGRVITPLLSNGVRKSSTGVNSTEEDINDSIPTLLTRDPSVDDSSDIDVVDPRLHDDRANEMGYDDGVVAYGGDGVDDRFAAGP